MADREPTGDPRKDNLQPPFEEGNLARVTHGGFSPRIYQPLAKQLAAWLIELRPDLDDPNYELAIAEWAESEARAALFRERLAKVGVFDGKGKPREFLLRSEMSASNRATAARKILGLDPRAAAELKKIRTDATVAGWDAEAAFDKARELDEARRSRAAIDAEARELAEAGVELVEATRSVALEAGKTAPEEG